MLTAARHSMDWAVLVVANMVGMHGAVVWTNPLTNWCGRTRLICVRFAIIGEMNEVEHFEIVEEG